MLGWFPVTFFYLCYNRTVDDYDRDDEARWDEYQSKTDELKIENRHREHVEDGIPIDTKTCQICEDIHDDDHDGDAPTAGCDECSRGDFLIHDTDIS